MTYYTITGDIVTREDTSGECHSILDEVWTAMPGSIAQACLYAK